METINIAKEIFCHLTSRGFAHQLRDLILERNLKEVQIDFADIDFAGRMFMDEYYREVHTNPNFKAIPINMAEDFRLMLIAVSHTQHNKADERDFLNKPVNVIEL